MTPCSRLLLSLIIICYFSFLFSIELPADTDPQVKTSRGVVVGLAVNHSSTTGALYHAFLGIPYAEKPARFQVAQPKRPWLGVLLAQNDGPACPQPTRLPSSEHCLYLNVFTPPGTDASSKLPVMVYLHGSAFSYSSSYSKNYGPDFLIPHGVVLVTVNYRLGVLGFLTLGERAAAGNQGLHDCLLALRWVRDEVSAFGGDPANVTLWGQSAGAALALLLYISPLSSDGVRGRLFQRVIAQSGSLAGWSHTTRAEARRRAAVLSRAVGCGAGDHTTVLTCLTRAHVQTLVNHTYIPLDQLTVPPGLDFPFIPVLDDSSWSDSPVFNEDIRSLVIKAQCSPLPLMIGFTTDEGITFIDRSERWKNVESILFSFTPQELVTDHSDGDRALLTAVIKNQYFSDLSPGASDDKSLRSLIRLYTDSQFAFPAIQLARQFKENTYLYLFAHDGSWRIPNSYFSQFHISGVSHGDDLPYVFAGKGKQTYDKTEENARNVKVKTYTAKLWAQFAKHGRFASCEWKTVDEGFYLRIDSKPELRTLKSLETRYYDFWSTLSERPLEPKCSKQLIFTQENS